MKYRYIHSASGSEAWLEVPEGYAPPAHVTLPIFGLPNEWYRFQLAPAPEPKTSWDFTVTWGNSQVTRYSVDTVKDAEFHINECMLDPQVRQFTVYKIKQN